MPQSLRATIGRKTIDLFSTTSLESHAGILPYNRNVTLQTLEIFSASAVLSHGSIMLPSRQPRVFARLARWQLNTANKLNLTSFQIPVEQI